MFDRFLKLLERIEARFDKPAKRHPLNPGSEQMIDSETPDVTGRSVRHRRSGLGLGPNDRRP